MDLGFSGDVVDFYHKYRRGYPAGVFDVLARTLNLTEDDIAVDLGCGTGQITVPLAGRVGAVIGMDPSPDMLSRARHEAGVASHEAGVASREAGVASREAGRASHAPGDHSATNISWLLGTDADLPHLTALLGEHSIAAITVGQALHWMDHETLFRAAKPLLRPRGGIAILTNGTPLWLQPVSWSRALKATLEQWLDTKLSYACGTDQEAQDRYARALGDAGYDVFRESVDYDDDLTLDQIIGGVFSAASHDKDQREILADNIRQRLAKHAPFREHVRVALVIGRT
ncbi:MAG TPA: methyltransferase domain-containing protein [Streptosporangiaceae bacterium]|nr:methyltransferase domain-containing protein [Streptosporangiaceae bacterium]